MPIAFTCPHCGMSMNVGDQYAGQTGPCGKCGHPITIPSPQSASFGAPTSGAFPAGPASPAMGNPAGSSGGKIVLFIILGVVGFGVLMCGGLLAALFIPAVSNARQAANRVQCQNNLKQLALAIHNYHDAYRSLPPAYTVDANGKPLHSWRVLLLPFLEYGTLYDQLHLDEPWDSPHNLALSAQMPRQFRCPNDTTPGQTRYVAVADPAGIFSGAQGIDFRAVLDGTANTILIVESQGGGVNWMEPRDITLDEFVNQSLGMQGPHQGGANVAFADGSVRFLSGNRSPDECKALVTRAGGENVSAH